MKWNKVLAIIILIIHGNTDVRAQVQWNSAQNWKLYNGGDSSFVLSLEAIKGHRYYQLSPDSMKYFLDSVTLLPSDVQPAWMGVYLTSCVIEGEIRKVLISYYAGFFYDEKSRRYYQIPPSKKAVWRSYLEGCLTSIQ